jgi:hypothetical protein
MQLCRIHFWHSLYVFQVSRQQLLADDLQDLMFTTIPEVFRDTYGWSTGLSGLGYTPCEYTAVFN